MLRKQKEGIQWLEFELLADIADLVHGVFLRHGGVSEGPYRSLHVGKNEGCDSDAIEENRSRIKKIIGTDRLISDPLISAYQVHGASIKYVQGLHEEIPPCDGLMTNRADLGLMIKHADCQAAIFFDTEHKAIANVHCGWRGNVQNIYGATVLEMQKQFASRPENILVGISPSLGPERSEFINYKRELPESFLPFQIKPAYFDLWAISRMQLEIAGILPHHIQIAGICTYTHGEDFFSFRRDNRVTGNHGTVAVLRQR
jgi:polyphenol oxidase